MLPSDVLLSPLSAGAESRDRDKTLTGAGGGREEREHEESLSVESSPHRRTEGKVGRVKRLTGKSIKCKQLTSESWQDYIFPQTDYLNCVRQQQLQSSKQKLNQN